MDAGESPSVARRRLGVTAAAIEKAEKREREVA
jgi:hypothetical protein